MTRHDLAHWLSLAVLAILLYTDSCAWAQGPVADPPPGIVLAVRGTVQVRRNGDEEKRLRLRDPIYEGDIVATGKRGRIQIGFRDDSIISLGNNTELELSEYVFKPDESKAGMVTTIKQGFFRVLGGAITKISPESFKTKTPTATIGIRGSFYVGSATPTRTVAAFLGGVGIYMSNNFGTEDTDDVGTIIVATADAAPDSTQDTGLLTTLLTETANGGTDQDDTTPDGDGGDGDGGDGDDADPGFNAGDEDGDDPLLGKGEQAGDGTDGDDGTTPTDDPEDDVDPDDRQDRPETSTLQGYAIARTADGELVINRYPAAVQMDVVLEDNTVTDGSMALTYNNNELDIAIDATDAEGSTALAADSSSGRLDLRNLEGSAYFKWGTWNLEYHQDSEERSRTNGTTIPDGLVLVGAPTPRDVVAGYFEGPEHFQGEYSGNAVLNETRHGTTRQYTGDSAFIVRFYDESFVGAMDFTGSDGPTMRLSGSVGAEGFQGAVNSISFPDSGSLAIDSSGVRGTFFGPGGQAVGGSLNAVTSMADYFSVFGAQGRVFAIEPSVRQGFSIGRDSRGNLFLNNSPEAFEVVVNRIDGTTVGEMNIASYSTAPERPGTERNPAVSVPLEVTVEGNGPAETTVLAVDTEVAKGNGVIQPFETPEPPEYMDWGDWNLEFHNPNNPVQTEIIQNGLYVVGERTPQEVIEGYFQGPEHFEGHYDGHAFLHETARADGATAGYTGTSDVTVRFYDRSFSGGMDFTGNGGPTMGMSGQVDATGIHGGIDSLSFPGRAGAETINTSGVRGAFFGPAAENIGGSFNAGTNRADYMGVFGGAGSVAPVSEHP